MTLLENELKVKRSLNNNQKTKVVVTIKKKNKSWCNSTIPCIIGDAGSWNPICHASGESKYELLSIKLNIKNPTKKINFKMYVNCIIIYSLYKTPKVFLFSNFLSEIKVK